MLINKIKIFEVKKRNYLRLTKNLLKTNAFADTNIYSTAPLCIIAQILKK